MSEVTPRRPRRSLLGQFALLFLISFASLSVLAAVVAAVGGSPRLAAGAGGHRIEVIHVSGVISAEAEEAGFLSGGGAGAAQLIGAIRQAADDDKVKAVILRINSPGGSAAASQEIFEAVMAAREKKPFVASLADVAASGGYYIAAACNKIIANRATMTASIGVIMSGYDASDLMDWAGVKPQTITSGKNKDIGAFDRPMRADERQLLQSMVNEVYEQFIDDVSLGRGLPEAKLRQHADGRIMNGSTAKKAGLVDELGGFWDAVTVAKELCGMPPGADPGIDSMAPKTFLEQLLETRVNIPVQVRPTIAPPPGYGGGLMMLAPFHAFQTGG